MTPKDKLLALLAKAEELEAKATKATPEIVAIRPGANALYISSDPTRPYNDLYQQEVMEKYPWIKEELRKPHAELMRLSRNSFLPVLRMLVERLDECNGCFGSGEIMIPLREIDPNDGKIILSMAIKSCPSCTLRYAALCAELEKLEVI